MSTPGHRASMTAPIARDRELQDAREQLAASREILAALGRDVVDPGAVMETVLEYAARLCGAAAAQLFLLDGDVFRISWVAGETPEEYREYLLEAPDCAEPAVHGRSCRRGQAHPPDSRRPR